MERRKTLRGLIRKNYAKVAKGSANSCCGSGCVCGGTPVGAAEAAQRIGYPESDIGSIPEGANMGLGCGNPLAIASLREGETVLDLGCGGGFDCFLASRRVGAHGRVIGVDMTPEMIALARGHAEQGGYANVEFLLGDIERLPVADGTADVIVSNCVINLSADKRQVCKEAYRALKPGGRLSISDVVALRPLPAELQNDAELVSGCIGGAELRDHFRAMLAEAGFQDIRITPKEQSDAIVGSWGFPGHPEDYVASCDIVARKPEDVRRR